MKIEVKKKFKDKDGNERTQGEIIDTEEDDSVDEGLAKDIVSKGFAEKIEEVPDLSTKDPFVESYTTWWKEIFEGLKKEESIDLSARQLVDATNQILGEVGKCKRQDKIGNGRGSGESKSKNKNGKPATEKQKSYLNDLGVDFKEPLSKSKASDLIEKAQSEQPATDKQKQALKKANSWREGMSKKEASKKLDKIYNG